VQPSTGNSTSRTRGESSRSSTHHSQVDRVLYYKGRLFFLDDDRRIITCTDPKTGQTKWQGELPGRGVIRASLTGADDKLYVISELREATVLAAGDEFKILHQTKLGATGRGFTRSTIVAAGGRLFIRTSDNLYCISHPEKAGK
jgi:outer membrane protein assembly factor BamB